MKVIVEIELGNDAAQDDADVVDLLILAVADIRRFGIPRDEEYKLRDINGNTVGKVAFLDDDDIKDCPNCSHGEYCWFHNPKNR